MIGLHVDLMIHHQQEALAQQRRMAAAAQQQKQETPGNAGAQLTSSSGHNRHGVVSLATSSTSLASSHSSLPLDPAADSAGVHTHAAHGSNVHNGHAPFDRYSAYTSPGAVKIAPGEAMDTAASPRGGGGGDSRRELGYHSTASLHSGGVLSNTMNSRVPLSAHGLAHHNQAREPPLSATPAHSHSSAPYLASSPTSADELAHMMRDIDDVPDVFTPSTELPHGPGSLQFEDTIASPYTFLSEFDDDVALHRGVRADDLSHVATAAFTSSSSHDDTAPTSKRGASESSHMDTSRPTHLRAFLSRNSSHSTHNTSTSHASSLPPADTHDEVPGETSSRSSSRRSSVSELRTGVSPRHGGGSSTASASTARQQRPVSASSMSELGGEEFPRDLWDACRRGSAVFVEFFLRDDPSLNDNTNAASLDADDHSPLFYACAGGHVRLVVMLLEHNPMQFIDSSTECYERATQAVRNILDAHLKWQVARDDEILRAWQHSSDEEEAGGLESAAASPNPQEDMAEAVNDAGALASATDDSTENDSQE